MKKKILLTKKFSEKVINADNELKWESDLDNGIVFQNQKLGLILKYYAVVDKNSSFLYDTFGIEERTNNCVSVIVNQNNRIFLLNEYRLMPEKYFMSCPRGFADTDFENRIICSLREIEEEVGEYDLIETKDLGDLYYNTTFNINPIGVRLVKINIKNNYKITDSQKNEDIEGIKLYSSKEIKQLIKNGKIECGITLAALAKYFTYCEE